VKLLLDEHFSFRIAEQLRKRGFDVVGVAERADLRELSDEDLVARAHDDGRAIVTEDVRDFLAIHSQCLNGGEPHSGFIFTSPHRFPRATLGIGSLVSALAKVLADHPEEVALPSDVLWLQPPEEGRRAHRR
jgi:predicted nuclease of predicted toxin-antitoxin system